MLGSPTALANITIENILNEAVQKYHHGLYVPSGALWGGEDIRKMAERGSLKGKTNKIILNQESMAGPYSKLLRQRNLRMLEDGSPPEGSLLPLLWLHYLDV